MKINSMKNEKEDPYLATIPFLAYTQSYTGLNIECIDRNVELKNSQDLLLHFQVEYNYTAEELALLTQVLESCQHGSHWVMISLDRMYRKRHKDSINEKVKENIFLPTEAKIDKARPWVKIYYIDDVDGWTTKEEELRVGGGRGCDVIIPKVFMESVAALKTEIDIDLGFEVEGEGQGRGRGGSGILMLDDGPVGVGQDVEFNRIHSSSENPDESVGFELSVNRGDEAQIQFPLPRYLRKEIPKNFLGNSSIISIVRDKPGIDEGRLYPKSAENDIEALTRGIDMGITEADDEKSCTAQKKNSNGNGKKITFKSPGGNAHQNFNYSLVLSDDLPTSQNLDPQNAPPGYTYGQPAINTKQTMPNSKYRGKRGSINLHSKSREKREKKVESWDSDRCGLPTAKSPSHDRFGTERVSKIKDRPSIMIPHSKPFPKITEIPGLIPSIECIPDTNKNFTGIHD